MDPPESEKFKISIVWGRRSKADFVNNIIRSRTGGGTTPFIFAQKFTLLAKIGCNKAYLLIFQGLFSLLNYNP